MKILLVCSAGMSTAFLIKSLEKSAKDKNIEHFEALAIASNELEDYDVTKFDLLLIAPQIKYKYDSIVDYVDNKVGIYLIPPTEYTPIGASNLMDSIQAKLGDK